MDPSSSKGGSFSRMGGGYTSQPGASARIAGYNNEEKRRRKGAADRSQASAVARMKGQSIEDLEGSSFIPRPRRKNRLQLSEDEHSLDIAGLMERIRRIQGF